MKLTPIYTVPLTISSYVVHMHVLWPCSINSSQYYCHYIGVTMQRASRYLGTLHDDNRSLLFMSQRVSTVQLVSLYACARPYLRIRLV